MARYEHLPLYKATYDTSLIFHRLSRGFSKEYKYGLAQEVKHCMSMLLDNIVIANGSAHRVGVLADSLVLVECIKNKIRMLKDLGVINIQRYEYLSRQLIDISKQLEKWKSWAERGGS